MSSEVVPLKIGVRFKHPAIVLLYEEDSKFRKRIMPIRGLKKSSPVATIVQQLKEYHTRYLQNVPDFKIEKMLRLVQNDMKGLDLEENLDEVQKEFTVNSDEDLNGADDARLRRKKEIMDVTFERNRKKPGDLDFQYDLEVDFEPGIESSAWDSEKDNDSEF